MSLCVHVKGKVSGPRKELPYLKAHDSVVVPTPAQILSDETGMGPILHHQGMGEI